MVVFGSGRLAVLPSGFFAYSRENRPASVEAFRAETIKWLETARHPRWKQPYTALAYQPMQEVINFLRANGFRTYIVTGSIQDFVRVFAEHVYGIPPEQVIGSADTLKYGYDADGKPLLTIEPKVLLDDDFAGKPDDIHLIIGRRPFAAFGNSTGDRQMLEYTKAGRGLRLAMDALRSTDSLQQAEVALRALQRDVKLADVAPEEAGRVARRRMTRCEREAPVTLQ